MQGLASDPVKNRMIQKIPRQRTANIFHMHPDLMSPPRIQMQLHKSISIADCKTLIMSHGSLPTLKINLPCDHRSIHSGNRGGDRPPFRWDPVSKCKIGTSDLALLHLGREKSSAQRVLGKHQHPGGIPVQPVDSAVDKSLPLLLIIPGNTVGKRILVVSGRGMHRHISRLVQHKDILILIQDI